MKLAFFILLWAAFAASYFGGLKEYRAEAYYLIFGALLGYWIRHWMPSDKGARDE